MPTKTIWTDAFGFQMAVRWLGQLSAIENSDNVEESKMSRG